MSIPEQNAILHSHNFREGNRVFLASAVEDAIRKFEETASKL
jgi:hypothetical protein